MTEPEIPIQPAMPERKATLRFGKYGLNSILIFVILCIAIPLVILGYRTIQNFKARRDISIARSNLHAIYEALSHYTEDWDGKLPPADQWTFSAAGYLPYATAQAGGAKSCLNGPGDEGKVGYVYNDMAAGFNMQDERENKVDPRDLVLLVESTGAPENAHESLPNRNNMQSESALYKLLSFPHYAFDNDNATTIILYANGRIEEVTRKDMRH